MSSANLRVVQNNPEQTSLTPAGSRHELSAQVSQGEWAQLANQLPKNEQLVITQSNNTQYTIRREQLPDPTQQQKAAAPGKGSLILLGMCIIACLIFALSFMAQYS